MTVPEHISVVYVEDDERLARLTQRYLESHGVVVTLARDGREGLSQALKVWPDVVLLDLMLPHVDGVELCRQLRARADVPIIMVTARGEEADRVLGLEAGSTVRGPTVIGRFEGPARPRERRAWARMRARSSRELKGLGT